MSFVVSYYLSNKIASTEIYDTIPFLLDKQGKEQKIKLNDSLKDIAGSWAKLR